MQGGTTSGWVTDQGSHKYGQYVGAIPAIFSTRLAECRPSSVLTLATIAIDGPFLHGRDDSIFQNFGASLPVSSNIQYREYTVDTVGLRRRGQRRIVTAGSPNRQPSGFSSIYYTDDHYATFFFVI